MNLVTIIAIVSGVVAYTGTIAGGGWWLSNELNEKADKAAVAEDVTELALKNDYLYDIQIERVLERLGELLAKAREGKANRYELREIEDLKRELERLRRMRQGSKPNS